MNTFEYINKNKSEIEKLNNANLLKYKVIYYFSIYSRYLYYLNLGHNKTVSINQSCKDNYVSLRRGFDAIKQMEVEI